MRGMQDGSMKCCTCAEELCGGAVGKQVQCKRVGVAAAQRVAGHPHRQPRTRRVVALRHHPRDFLQVALCSLVEAAVHLDSAAPCCAYASLVRPTCSSSCAAGAICMWKLPQMPRFDLHGQQLFAELTIVSKQHPVTGKDRTCNGHAFLACNFKKCRDMVATQVEIIL